MISRRKLPLPLPLLLLAGTTIQSAEATIQFLDGSPKTFPSRVDEHLGQPLMKGYDYMGRIQYLADNIKLCPDRNHPHRKFEIIPPADGLPVALLAKAGGCSIHDKIRVASTLVTPSNTVAFLIVQDGGSAEKLGDATPATTDSISEARDSIFSLNGHSEDDIFFLDAYGTDLAESMENGRGLIQRDDEDKDEPDRTTSSLSWSPPRSSGGSALGLGMGKTDLFVLEVSYDTGNDILDQPFFPFHKRGGPRVVVNAKGSETATRTIVLWMLVTFSGCACMCACLLLCVNTVLEDEEEEAPPPRRPVRRRLTLDEVRERFPSYRFHPESHDQVQPLSVPGSGGGLDKPASPEGACCPTHSGGGAEGFLPTAKPPSVVVHNDYMQLTDECTICLDEFVPGVKVRKLPCGHVFHATCIAKWLIERSAVCPLCKLDLYVEPEEESDDDESDTGNQRAAAAAAGEPRGPLASLLGSLFGTGGAAGEEYTPLAVASGSAEEAVPDNEPNNNNNNDGDEQEQRSWWPFSMEIVPAGSEEDERGGAAAGDDEHTDGGERARRQRSPLSAAASGAAYAWNAVVGGVGVVRRNRRRRRQQRRGTDTGATISGTELTEPLLVVSAAADRPPEPAPAASSSSPGGEAEDLPPAAASTSAEI